MGHHKMCSVSITSPDRAERWDTTKCAQFPSQALTEAERWVTTPLMAETTIKIGQAFCIRLTVSVSVLQDVIKIKRLR